MTKILGEQNTPCGHYDNDRDINCDAITCDKIKTPKGWWHLHRYYARHEGRAKHCRSDQWVFVKLGWSARMVSL